MFTNEPYCKVLPIYTLHKKKDRFAIEILIRFLFSLHYGKEMILMQLLFSHLNQGSTTNTNMTYLVAILLVSIVIFYT